MRYPLLASLLLGASLGCGSSGPRSPTARQADRATDEAGQAPALGAVKGEAGRPAKRADGRHQSSKQARKIIFTAQVHLIVEDFDKARERLHELLRKRDGYVARSEERGGQVGSPRGGEWIVRVPAAKLDAFLEALGGLGEVARSTLDSEDVTDAYYELAAHIKNDEAREQGLRKRLEKAVDKGTDWVVIDRELNDLRSKIDARKGQMKRWDKLTRYATVTVNLTSRKDYTPPASIEGTFKGSIDAMVTLGRFLVLASCLTSSCPNSAALRAARPDRPSAPAVGPSRPHTRPATPCCSS
jgi:hypothetical protein